MRFGDNQRRMIVRMRYDNSAPSKTYKKNDSFVNDFDSKSSNKNYHSLINKKKKKKAFVLGASKEKVSPSRSL